jgi:hypothetical protein
MFRHITYHLRGAWLAKFSNQQSVVFIVVIVRSVCVAVAYKMKLKCGPYQHTATTRNTASTDGASPLRHTLKDDWMQGNIRINTPNVAA